MFEWNQEYDAHSSQVVLQQTWETFHFYFIFKTIKIARNNPILFKKNFYHQNYSNFDIFFIKNYIKFLSFLKIFWFSRYLKILPIITVKFSLQLRQFLSRSFSTYIIHDQWKSNEQRAKNNEQRVKNNEQRVISNKQRTKNNEQRTESYDQRAKSNK